MSKSPVSVPSAGLCAALCAVLCGLLGLMAGPARAAPRVAADIPPVHALVAQVMDGIGTPDLIMGGGASPHGHALRPSEARALQAADLVVWIGPGLTPWLGMALPTLAKGADLLTLAAHPGTRTLPARSAANFGLEADAHGDHDNHEDHEQGDAHGHDPAALADGLVDPHLWLDPGNAEIWLDEIAARLARLDPANAARYAENARTARAGLAALRSDLDAMLAPVRGGRYVVFHDGYQYFERAFDMPAAGAIALSDASDPSPARIAEIRSVVRQGGIACVFSEPQLNTALIAPVFEGTEVRLAVADPLGAALPPGPALYGDVLRGLAGALSDCLK
ncbi:zinc transporter [Meridianimarinicoccus roseus]|uniref:High-affinity zinc uptake system protein ZnuA n=1 Tax=Meridianimarinicoccus roseus TaxID=2072018 RepID=A0A2V2LBS7_9RHOB|nr:zinc ABC transporter substrate-binding protein [Meridianimarinicoccus roseus]PWR02632.1 zinc transporter [Meridianimarinicoccus roseus]